MYSQLMASKDEVKRRWAETHLVLFAATTDQQFINLEIRTKIINMR